MDIIQCPVFIENDVLDTGLSLRPQGKRLFSWAQWIHLIPISSLRNAVLNKNRAMNNIQEVNNYAEFCFDYLMRLWDYFHRWECFNIKIDF
jgi:hypothetical protein